MPSKTLALVIILGLFHRYLLVESASCKSGEYCPQHWQVLRRTADQSAYTCDPMRGQTKCPKPYQCIHSKCGISFCCAHQVVLETWRREKELEEEMQQGDDEEL